MIFLLAQHTIPTTFNSQKNNFNEIFFSKFSSAAPTRAALVSARIPQGSDLVIMLVGSATTNRWKR